MHNAGLGVLPPPSVLATLPSFSAAGCVPVTSMPSGLAVTPSIASLIPPVTPSTPTLTARTSYSFPLPEKLVRRILDREYVDMAELVPDSWRFQDEEQNKCCHQNRRLRRGPVTDILLWIKCYAPMVAVLSSGFPQKIPELMAYQKTIVRAYRSFSGDGWVTYDACYRRKAAVTKSLDWGEVDFTLYNETFTGRAKPIARCKFCLSEHHISSECTYAPEMPSHKPESVTSVRLHCDTGKSYIPTCHLFNKAGNICRFNPCRFGHVCIVCQGAHPASQSRSRPLPPKWRRADSPAGKGRK